MWCVGYYVPFLVVVLVSWGLVGLGGLAVVGGCLGLVVVMIMVGVLRFGGVWCNLSRLGMLYGAFWLRLGFCCLRFECAFVVILVGFGLLGWLVCLDWLFSLLITRRDKMVIVYLCILIVAGASLHCHFAGGVVCLLCLLSCLGDLLWACIAWILCVHCCGWVVLGLFWVCCIDCGCVWCFLRVVWLDGLIDRLRWDFWASVVYGVYCFWLL